GDGDAAALADAELRDPLAPLLKRREHPLGHLRARVRVAEEPSRHHDVRLHEDTPAGHETQLVQSLAHDRSDPIGVVVGAVAQQDPRVARWQHLPILARLSREGKRSAAAGWTLLGWAQLSDGRAGELV